MDFRRKFEFGLAWRTLLIIGAIIICAIAGALIGLPTLRLRGDYIAIVTLAFGEIIGRIAINGDALKIGGQPLPCLGLQLSKARIAVA